jgi:hypothetical protein
MAKHSTPDTEDAINARATYAGRDCTLNGRPAYVSGSEGGRFARIVDRATGLSAEWCWQSVAHIFTDCAARFTAR